LHCASAFLTFGQDQERQNREHAETVFRRNFAATSPTYRKHQNMHISGLVSLLCLALQIFLFSSVLLPFQPCDRL